MFTNEFFEKESVTTVMDETAQFEDIQICIGDDCVYLRQYNPKSKLYEVIMMSPKMYYDLLESRNHTEGLFITKLNPRQ